MPAAIGLLLAVALADRPVPDLALPDPRGVSVRLAADAGPATVVVFLGVDCPLAQLYAARLNRLAGRFPPGAVRVVAVNSNDYDAPPAMADFARDHRLTFPYLKDADGRAAMLFGATRTPEAVVLDAGRRVRYRGRVDDQYAPGRPRRPEPTRDDLFEAVADVVAGRAVAVPRTDCVGCLISRPRPAPPAAAVTYTRDVAPVIARRCVVCHRPGEAGPFPLTTFAHARDHAATVAEAVEAGTMPPWHAAPGVGHFRNDPRLSAAEKRVVAEWVRLGCPEGDGPPAPADAPPATGWALGTPDAVVPIPAPFAVPAEGVVEYQHFLVDPGFTTDVWVRAVEVRPGNRRVVHHCNVFLHPPTAGGTDDCTRPGRSGRAT